MIIRINKTNEQTLKQIGLNSKQISNIINLIIDDYVTILKYNVIKTRHNNTNNKENVTNNNQIRSIFK